MNAATSKLWRVRLPWLAFVLCLASSASADDALDGARPFLKAHCVRCHGPDKQENDKRFDTLGDDLSHKETLETWQEIVDQLNLGQMPPPEEPQPAAAEVEKFVDTLSARLRLAYAQQRSTGSQAVIRRLNKVELRNTLRDLLYLEGAAYRANRPTGLVDNSGNGHVKRQGDDPVGEFPDDEQADGFSNLGDKLVMSDFLLKLTLQAAQETVEAATHTGPRPQVETRRFAGHLLQGKQYGQQTLSTVSRELHDDHELIVLRYQNQGRLSPHELRGGVRTSARYRITVEASGHHQQHLWGELVETDQSQPFLLGLHIADTANGGLAGPTSTPLAAWELPGDGRRRTFSLETFIDKTWTPWLGWENGPYSRQFSAERLVEKYLPEMYRPRPDKQADKAGHDGWPVEMAQALLASGYRGPHIRIYSITVEPIIDTWPPQSHTQLFGGGPPENADVDALLLAFAQRAYRRPVEAAEVAPYAKLVRRLMEEPREEQAAPITGLKYRAYKGSWTKLPDFDSLQPAGEGELANGLIDLRPANAKEHFGMVFTGKLKVPQAGDYEFELGSDDGSRLMVGDQQVILHDGLHGASVKKGKAQLEAGDHPIRVEYFAYGQPNSLRLLWSGPTFRGEPLSVTPTQQQPVEAANERSARATKALQAGYVAMLCSPKFLYLREQPGRLDDYAIASRLSYFLWSSMPDERLFQLAADGKLTDKAIVRAEVERMLADPKAEAFTRNFTIAWLRLDKLGKMPPEKAGPFRFYHDRKMEPTMLALTVAYFADMVDRNGPIADLIDSDYAFMNETTAFWLYGRDDVGGDRIQRVKVNDPRRGGIFTDPAVMTATANGVDTSPITRGVFVLENILGTPPAPPPPDVEPLSPDLREAKTLKEQLSAHREHAACNSCHRKIDPLGFAMENFDPVGRWRDRYPKARDPLDASAVMADGQEIANIVEFKQMLLTRVEQVTRCLTEKLLTYASGRRLEPTDRGEVDEIVKALRDQRGGVRDLVHLVVQSEIFLEK